MFSLRVLICRRDAASPSGFSLNLPDDRRGILVIWVDPDRDFDPQLSQPMQRTIAMLDAIGTAIPSVVSEVLVNDDLGADQWINAAGYTWMVELDSYKRGRPPLATKHLHQNGASTSGSVTPDPPSTSPSEGSPTISVPLRRPADSPGQWRTMSETNVHTVAPSTVPVNNGSVDSW